MSAPLIVLGVSRSGTTLLRVMLDRNSELAIPDESFFIPQLADRHGRRIDPERFVDDLRRLPAIRDWGVPLDDVRRRLRPELPLGEAIAAVYEAYAAREGKRRWGDKTPMYMRHLGLLDRLFPDAEYVHLIRDGRDAAVSFLAMPEGISAGAWAKPRSVAEFGCEWRREVTAARRLGARVGPARYHELRYEALVEDPERELRRICAFAGLSFDSGMLEGAGESPSAAKPHQQRLKQAPTGRVRDWRTELDEADERAFEDLAGDLLAELGYEVRHPGRQPVGARVRRAAYAARTAAWRAAGYANRRSPLWRRRHPPLVEEGLAKQR
jgi:Sulfotransferase family